MNTNRQDAIKMAIKLKRKGLLDKQIVRELGALGYRNPKTLKPWTKGLVGKRIRDIKPDVDTDAIAKAMAIEYRIEGHQLKDVAQLLKQDGFINIRTGKPYGMHKVNEWLNGIEPRHLTEAKAKAQELADGKNYATAISKKLAELGYINKYTGKPYSKSAIENWLYAWG
jgi:exonuclease V gamma subunit